MKQKMTETISKVEREGWNAENLVEESAGVESDEIIRQLLRGDESIGDPDDRDIIGSARSINSDYTHENGNESKPEAK